MRFNIVSTDFQMRRRLKCKIHLKRQNSGKFSFSEIVLTHGVISKLLCGVERVISNSNWAAQIFHSGARCLVQ